MADIEAHGRDSGNHVGSTGLSIDLAHRSHQAWRVAHFTLDFDDPLRGTSERIFAQTRRGGARMSCGAFKANFHAALPGDGVDDSERQAELLEHRALFDMKFEVSGKGRLQPRERQFSPVQAELANRTGHQRDGAIIQIARHSAASEKWNAEANAFLFGESDQFDGERRLARAERFDQCHAHHYAENAVECSGMNHGIEVGANEESWSIAGTDGAKIARGIDVNVATAWCEPIGKRAMHMVHGLREVGARGPARFFGVARQLAAAFHDPSRRAIPIRSHEPLYVL